jgi:hypothetical protein
VRKMSCGRSSQPQIYSLSTSSTSLSPFWASEAVELLFLFMAITYERRLDASREQITLNFYIDSFNRLSTQI